MIGAVEELSIVAPRDPSLLQGTSCTGKTEKMAKNWEFGKFAKTQGIWFAQVVSS